MDDDSESSQDSSSSGSTCESVPTPPRNYDPPSLPVQVATDIDSELFQRLQPVHYIILSILKEETPVSLLPVCQDLYSELSPTLYKTFVLDKDTYRDKMRGAYNRRLVIKNGDEKLESVEVQSSSAWKVEAFRHVKRLTISDVYAAQRLFLDCDDTQTRWLTEWNSFPQARTVVLGSKVMACVARPTKVYINVKSLIDNLNISRSLKTYMLVWPISKTKSMDIVRYIPIYAEEEESDADESDGSNDDADSPSGSETDADDSSDCDSESDADTDTEPETDYETDDDSDEDNASDDQFSDKEYNIGRFIVHRLAVSPTLTEIVICITSKHLNDATLRLKHLEKEIKIVYLVQRDSTPMYDVILSVWKHFLTCVILYNFDRVKFKIKYDLTRINEIAPQLQKLEDKWAGGDDLLWQMFMKSLYLPKGTLVSPFSSASQPPSGTV